MPPEPSRTGMEGFRKEEAQCGVAAPEEDRPLYVIDLNTPRRSEVIANALLKCGYCARAAEKVLGANFVPAAGRIWN